MAVTDGHGNPNWTRDETILALALYFKLEGKIPSSDDNRIQELSTILRDSPIHPVEIRKSSFRNPDGVGFKLQNIKSVATGKGLSNTSEMDKSIWEEFGNQRDKVIILAERIRQGIMVIGEGVDISYEVEEEESFSEGKIITALHKRRERSPKLRKAKIGERRSKNQLFCEICGTKSKWDLTLPEDGIFECHHIVPLAEGERKETKISDLALLCASCHRMIHMIISRKKKWVKIEEVKLLYNNSGEE